MNSSYYVDTSYGVSNTTGLFGALASFGLFFLILSMALGVLMIISLWKIFKKAGKPGWASIVPIYNIYIMCEIAEKEWWYVLLSCVPFVNIYAMIVLYNGVAKKFGKGGGFVVGMILLPVVFFPMLAFGKDATIVNNHPNISNENNMTDDNTLGANANTVPNMNGQTMITNEMVTPNNPVMNEPVMSNPEGIAPFGNTNVTQNLNAQNIQNVQNTSEVQAPVMSQTSDNTVAPSFDNVTPSMTVQAPVMNNSENLNMNVNIQQDEIVQSSQINQAPVMPQSSDNVAPAFNNIAQDNIQMPVTPNTMDAAQNVNARQNIGPSLESVQNNPVMNEPVMPQPNDNVAPSFDNVNNNANQSVNEEVSSNAENAMNTAFSTQEEMLDINDAPDAQNVIDTNVQTHTSMWSNKNQNNGQM